MAEPLKYSIPLPKLGKKPPREIRLLKWGINPATPLPLFLTKEGAQTILDRFNENGHVLPWDIDHGTVDKNLAPSERRAIGHFSLELKDDGIWATQIEWNDEGAEKVRAGNFLYYSPSVRQVDIGVGGLVHEITAAAITNYPRMKKLQPLLMSRTSLMNTQKTMPSEELLSQIMPLKKIHQSASILLNDVQSYYSSSLDPQTNLSLLADTIGMAVPTWIEQLGMMIEELDPEGLTEMSIESQNEQGAKMTTPIETPAAFSLPASPIDGEETAPPIIPQTKPVEVPMHYSAVIDMCKKITGTEDPEAMIALLRVKHQNEATLKKQLQVNQHHEIERMVLQGIKDGLIPAHERSEFLGYSKRQVEMHLSQAIPLAEPIHETGKPPVHVPTSKPEDPAVLEDVKDIFRDAHKEGKE